MSNLCYIDSRGVQYNQNDLLYTDSVSGTKPIIGICVHCAVQKGNSLDSGMFKFSTITSLEEEKASGNPRECFCQYHLAGCVYPRYNKYIHSRSTES